MESVRILLAGILITLARPEDNFKGFVVLNIGKVLIFKLYEALGRKPMVPVVI
jgi:hypothetical protein